jgi:hypothetical protein
MIIQSINPRNIDNIKYWFDSSDVSTLSLTGIGSVTASVISIKDKVNGVVLTSTGTVRPLYYYNNINNCNSIYFQYTNNQDVSPNDRLSSTSITFSSTGSIYTVTKWGATSSVYASWAISIAPSSRPADKYGDFDLVYISPTDIQMWSTVGPSFNTVVGGFLGLPNGTQSDINSISVSFFNARYGLNSLSKFHNTNIYGLKDAYTNATYSLSTLSNELTIGDYYAGSLSATGYKGYFCELLFFDRYLSETEDNQISQYLKKKWIG